MSTLDGIADASSITEWTPELRDQYAAGIDPALRVDNNPYIERGIMNGFPPVMRAYMMPENAREEEQSQLTELNKLLIEAEKGDLNGPLEAGTLPTRIAALEENLKSNTVRLGAQLYMKHPEFQKAPDVPSAFAEASRDNTLDRVFNLDPSVKIL